MWKTSPSVSQKKFLFQIEELVCIEIDLLFIHGTNMVHQMMATAELSSTFVTVKRFLTFVNEIMGLELVGVRKVAGTQFTLVRSFSCVNA